MDEGLVISDSLGGVSNAYNITPQESTLNRHGDQAYMGKVIRDVGGVTDFDAIITYPDTKTHIPSSYQYTYTLKGNEIIDTFDNVNPDEVKETLGLTDSESSDKLVQTQTVIFSIVHIFIEPKTCDWHTETGCFCFFNCHLSIGDGLVGE